jgi:hypothetical protein
VGGSGIVGVVLPGRGLTRNATGSVDALVLICRLWRWECLLPQDRWACPDRGLAVGPGRGEHPVTGLCGGARAAAGPASQSSTRSTTSRSVTARSGFRGSLSSSEVLQQHLGTAHVVKVFNSINSWHLASLGRPAGAPARSAYQSPGTIRPRTQLSRGSSTRSGTTPSTAARSALAGADSSSVPPRSSPRTARLGTSGAPRPVWRPQYASHSVSDGTLVGSAGGRRSCEAGGVRPAHSEDGRLRPCLPDWGLLH